MSIEPTEPDIAFHHSWPAPAQTLVRRAIDRHGGWALWTRLEAVTVNLVALRGLLPWVKGYGRTFQLARSLTTFPKRVRTEFRDGSGMPCRVIFERGDMRLLDPATGRVQAESPDHRRTFQGRRRARRWDALDAHYFFGYAWASYNALPFILPSLPFLGATSCRRRGERLDGVRVEHPAEAQVHCRRQAYYFDAQRASHAQRLRRRRGRRLGRRRPLLGRLHDGERAPPPRPPHGRAPRGPPGPPLLRGARRHVRALRRPARGRPGPRQTRFLSLATARPIAAAPRSTRIGWLFTRRVARFGTSTAAFACLAARGAARTRLATGARAVRGFRAASLDDLVDVFRVFCFELMLWRHSHKRAKTQGSEARPRRTSDGALR